MPKVQAWELLNDHSYSGRLSMSELKELMLKAGFPEEEAHEAAMKRGNDRLDAGMTM